MSKYYAVRKGKQTGIFRSWDECKKATSGYKGAEFKSFLTEEEAEQYMDCVSFPASTDINKGFHIYTDGSYNAETAKYGSGFIILLNGKKIMYGEKAGDIPEYAVSRNVAGEIFSVLNALEQAVILKAEEVVIHYDYEGLEKWTDGEWRTNKELTTMYAEKVNQYRKNGMKIYFVHEKAHTGIEYNELADKIAKRSVGLATEQELDDMQKLLKGVKLNGIYRNRQ